MFLNLFQVVTQRQEPPFRTQAHCFPHTTVAVVQILSPVQRPLVETSEVGTEVVIKTTCSNPSCRKQNTWYSQPLIPGTGIPAGNFLLCLSILLSGGSATKVFTMFSHMGLGCISLNTFFHYERVSEGICCKHTCTDVNLYLWKHL